jgi:hypothetical protein
MQRPYPSLNRRTSTTGVGTGSSAVFTLTDGPSGTDVPIEIELIRID